MKETICMILSLVFAYYLVRFFMKEGFTSSGLSMSNQYCDRLVTTYYHPKNKDPTCNYTKSICGSEGCGLIENRRGNYYNGNNFLI